MKALKNGTTYRTKRYASQYASLDKKIDEFLKKKALVPLTRGEPLQVRDPYYVFCLSPDPQVAFAAARDALRHIQNLLDNVADKLPDPDQNTLSTILIFALLSAGPPIRRFTFGGDATKNDWDTGLKAHKQNIAIHNFAFSSLCSYFIKASHHGSKYSSSQDIWQELLPTGNSDYVHTFFSSGDLTYPNTETLDHLERAAKLTGARILRHATNDRAISNNYPVEYVNMKAPNTNTIRKKVEMHGGGRPLTISSNDLVGYKYTYDLLTNTSTVTKLLQQ
jgi:hypothetical protein